MVTNQINDTKLDTTSIINKGNISQLLKKI